MKRFTTPSTVAQPFWPVKSTEYISLGTPSSSMSHHKVTLSRNKKLIVSYYDKVDKPYGRTLPYRFFSPELLRKKFDLICDCLAGAVRLSPGQLRTTLALLTLQAYYPTVYPKVAQLADQAGCSTKTAGRAIRRLEELGLLKRLPRYVLRPHAQISNLYLLKRLIILIVRYLAEHGTHFWEKWLRSYLSMPGSQFWSQIWQGPGDRAGPGVGEFSSS